MSTLSVNFHELNKILQYQNVTASLGRMSGKTFLIVFIYYNCSIEMKLK